MPLGGWRFVSALAPLYKQERECVVLKAGVPFRLRPTIQMERMMWYGVYERQMLSLFGRYLRKGDTVIDCGANIGWVSAFFLEHVGKEGRVLSFEPLPAHVVRLQRFAEIARANGYHMDVAPVALGAAAGNAELHIGKDNHGFNTIVGELTRPELTPTSMIVEVRTLDAVLAERGIDHARFAKIDVEGAEYGLLQGASAALSRHAFDHVYVEVSTKAARMQVGARDAVAALLHDFGYEGKAIHKGRLVALPDTWDEWIVETLWSAPGVT